MQANVYSRKTDLKAAAKANLMPSPAEILNAVSSRFAVDRSATLILDSQQNP